VIFQFTIIRESDGKERRDFGQWKKGAEFNGFVLEEESIAVKTSKREERS
jgi:exopolysaccharide biosynthesis predicted pyruvyltransferase EpsI